MTENKRFTFDEDVNEDDMYEMGVFSDNGKVMETIDVLNCLNNLHEENQALQKHIKRNTFNKIKVEDVFNCAKYDKFYDNEEAIKSIDWIAEQLGIDLE